MRRATAAAATVPAAPKCNKIREKICQNINRTGQQCEHGWNTYSVAAPGGLGTNVQTQPWHIAHLIVSCTNTKHTHSDNERRIHLYDGLESWYLNTNGAGQLFLYWVWKKKKYLRIEANERFQLSTAFIGNWKCRSPPFSLITSNNSYDTNNRNYPLIWSSRRRTQYALK